MEEFGQRLWNSFETLDVDPPTAADRLRYDGVAGNFFDILTEVCEKATHIKYLADFFR